MRELFCWIVWMFLAQQVYNSIVMHPEFWVSPEFWATLGIISLIVGAIEFKLIESWLKARYSGENESLKQQIELLQRQLESSKAEMQKLTNEIRTGEELGLGKAKELEPQQKLTDVEIKILEFIEAFELLNPTEPNQFPHECSVDEAASKMKIEWGQTNEAFRKLRKLNLATSLWDGQATFLGANQPVNEENPVRLTIEGKNYLRAYRQNSNLG